MKYNASKIVKNSLKTRIKVSNELANVITDQRVIHDYCDMILLNRLKKIEQCNNNVITSSNDNT